MAIVFDRVNKVIEVESPAVEVTIQALLNAIRDFEDDQENMDVAQIAKAAGKDDLGGGVAVAITLELLNNWQLMFEARSGPDWVQCIVKDGNLVGGLAGNPIKTSAYVQVKLVQSAYGTLTGGAGVWTEGEKDGLIATAQATKDKTDSLPTDPADQSLVEAKANQVLAAMLDDLDTMKHGAHGAYERERESLEAIRERGDEAWVTGKVEEKPKAHFEI